MAVQIVLGLLWMLGNFNAYQDFPESRELLEIADTLVTDEYVGILYPCLLKCVIFLTAYFQFPYFWLIYALQLGAGFWALWRLMDGLPGKKRIFWILWIMTMPPVMQLYLAVLPQSFALSALLLCLYSCLKGKWVKGAFYWLMGGILIPEYLLWGGGIFAISFLKKAITDKADRKRVLFQGTACAAAVCLSVGIASSFTVAPYSRGRMARTPAAMALHRLVWPDFSFNQFFWGEEVTSLFSEEDLSDISKSPYLVSSEFGYLMEKTYGRERAQAVYWQMAKDSFRIGTGKIVKDIMGDFLGYALSPGIIVWNLRGRGVSFSGWNYDRMSAHTPALTKFYVYDCGNVFPLFFLAGGLCFVIKHGVKRKNAVSGGDSSRLSRGIWGGVILVSLAMVLWYALTASGMQDYKNVMMVDICWGMLFLRLMEGSEVAG